MLLLSTSCVSPRGNCERTAFWVDEFEPKTEYAIALNDAFEFDENGRPTQDEVLYFRLNDLEKYCYQTRIQ